MTAPAAYVMAETPLREVANLLLREGISAAPVLDEGGNLVGMVSEGDLDGRDENWGRGRIRRLHQGLRAQKAAARLAKDREVLPAFFDFPARTLET